MFVFAQLPELPGGEQASAFNIVNTAINLSRNTSAAWRNAWDEIFLISHATGEVSLWTILVQLGLLLATLSILVVTFKDGKQILERQSWSELANLFVWPLAILIFLGNDGHLLAQSVVLVREVASQQVRLVLQVQVADLSFEQAISNVAITQAARQQIESVYLECRDKSGEELIACWNDPVKQQMVDAIIASAEAQQGGPLQALQEFGQGVKQMWDNWLSGRLFGDMMQRMVEAVFWAASWAFVNILEAAALMTAVVAPLALGLSMLPFGTRFIWAWAIGYLSLFGIQLGYNIVVGIAATVLVTADAQLASELAFPMFLSIFAPLLATTVATGGGKAMFDALNRADQQIRGAFASAVGGATHYIATRLTKSL